MSLQVKRSHDLSHKSHDNSLTANLAAPSCRSRGRQEMKINTATSHTPALGHAHILTDQSSHCVKVAKLYLTDCVATTQPGAHSRRGACSQQPVKDGASAHSHQRCLQSRCPVCLWRTLQMTPETIVCVTNSQKRLSPYHLNTLAVRGFIASSSPLTSPT